MGRKIRLDFRKMPEYTRPENYEYRRQTRESRDWPDLDEDRLFEQDLGGDPWLDDGPGFFNIGD